MLFKSWAIPLVLGVAALAAFGCGGSVGTASAGQGGGGGQASTAQTGAGGQGSGCTPSGPVSYMDCTGTTFFPDGSCAAGGCAPDAVAMQVFAAWRARVFSISAMSDPQFDARVVISSVEHTAPFVRIEYVVILDWARSRQADSINLMGASSPPTDAEIQMALNVAIEEPEWTSLGSIASAAGEDQVKAAFDSCACDIPIDWCHIDFENVTGIFRAEGIKEVDPGNNECLSARVDVATGNLQSCDPTPCAVN